MFRARSQDRSSISSFHATSDILSGGASVFKGFKMLFLKYTTLENPKLAFEGFMGGPCQASLAFFY